MSSRPLAGCEMRPRASSVRGAVLRSCYSGSKVSSPLPRRLQVCRCRLYVLSQPHAGCGAAVCHAAAETRCVWE